MSEPVDSATMLRKARGRLLVVAALALVGLLLGGCRPPDPPTGTDLVEVAGEVGGRPLVQFDLPLAITEISTDEIVTGAGAALEQGSTVMLSYLAIDAATGEVVDDNYGEQPRLLVLTQDQAGALYSDLLGRTEGSRLLRLEPGSMTRPDPVVIVYDILFTRAHGTALEIDPALPQVALQPDGSPVITIPDAEPPRALTIAQLIRGEGTQVQSGESVTVRFLQQAWSTGDVVESTWGEDSLPVTIPLVDRIPGLQEGLVDAAVGSQVLLVVPPDQADGTDTMVFVIDVLAVTTLSDQSEGAQQ
ncbi:MAG: FKBP-type peptidyl-prolyl cis-trans isomerase [Beutenbergiaceae bacterium]